MIFDPVVLAIIVGGVFYGLFVGLIPASGPGKALLTLFIFAGTPFFQDNSLAFVAFSMAVVMSCVTGDSFASVLMGIPGAQSSAATMVDGYPLARKGKGAYALSAAISTSTLQGLLWGLPVFLFMDYYKALVPYITTPRYLAVLMLSFAMVIFITNRHYFRTVFAIALGIWFGMIGDDPFGTTRYTFGFDYLEDGLSVVIVAAGIFAIPEIIEAVRLNYKVYRVGKENLWGQVWEGMRDSIKFWRWNMFGGAVGMFHGLLPGYGGGSADWLCYGIASKKSKGDGTPYGKGNIVGVIAPEGVNNAGKAGAIVPTILLGVPGGKWAMIIMGLWMWLGYDVGDRSILENHDFLSAVAIGYFVGVIATGILCLVAIRYLAMLLYIPARYYMIPLFVITIVSALSVNNPEWYKWQWVWGVEDLTLLFILSCVGYCAKRFKFSRPALLLAFILSEKIEDKSSATYFLYVKTGRWEKLLTDPTFMGIMIVIIAIAVYGIRNKSSINYA